MCVYVCVCEHVGVCFMLAFRLYGSACFKCRHVCPRLCDKWPVSVLSTGVAYANSVYVLPSHKKAAPWPYPFNSVCVTK